jgi:putative polyhydroxyalkanoate system protein
MGRLSVKHAHNLALPELTERVNRVAAKLCDRFGAASNWKDGKLLIKHSAVNGTIHLDTQHVLIEAELSFPLSLMTAQVRSEIDRVLNKELTA